MHPVQNSSICFDMFAPPYLSNLFHLRHSNHQGLCSTFNRIRESRLSYGKDTLPHSVLNFWTVSQLMSVILLVLLHLRVHLKLISLLNSRFQFCSCCFNLSFSFILRFNHILERPSIIIILLLSPWSTALVRSQDILYPKRTFTLCPFSAGFGVHISRIAQGLTAYPYSGAGMVFPRLMPICRGRPGANQR